MLSIYDLDSTESLHAIKRMRVRSQHSPATPEQLKEAVSYVGGRLSYLNKVFSSVVVITMQTAYNFFCKVAKAKNTVEMAETLKDKEKGWLLSQIGQ